MFFYLLIVPSLAVTMVTMFELLHIQKRTQKTKYLKNENTNLSAARRTTAGAIRF